MPIVNLLGKLQAAATALGIAAPSIGASKGKAYEVWIMLEIAARLKRRGVKVYPLNQNNQMETNLRVNGAPANMPGVDPSGSAACHFLFVRDANIVELHLGLNHLGLSGATHEIDLSVLPAAQGWELRQKGGGPFDGHVHVGLELKAHSDQYKLDHSIPRALLGVAIDLDPSWPIQGWTFHTAGGGSGCRMDRTSKTRLAVMTTTQLFDSSRQYLEHHGAGAHADVTPGGNTAAIDAVVDWIDELLA